MPDKNIATTLSAVYGDAKKHREKEIEEKWEAALKAYKAEQDTGSVHPTTKTRVTRTKTNFIFSQIETMKPILGSNRPTISLKAVMSYDEWWVWMAEEVTKNINRIFDRNDISVRQSELITNSLHFGKAYFKPIWNPEGFGGYGDVKIEVPDTRSIVLEPGKMSVKDSNYIFEKTACSRLTLLRKYPGMADQISSLFAQGSGGGRAAQPGLTSVRGAESVETNISAPGAAAETTSTSVFKAMDDGLAAKKKAVDLIEAWFWDPEAVEVLEDEMSDTGQPILTKTGNRRKRKRNVPKYPNGRLVQFAGHYTFRDQQNKFPGLPYIEYFNYSGPDWPYGLPEAFNLVPIQKQIDVRKNQVADILNTTLAPKVFFDTTAGLDPDVYTNEPGQLIPVRNVQGIKVVPPPSIGVAAAATIQELKMDMETVSGIREVSQGSIPGDIRSGNAIELLQESGETRMKGKSDGLEVADANLAKQTMQLVFKFYKDGVHWHVPNWIKEHKNWKEYVEGGNMSPDFFEFEVRAGVNLPRSRVAQQALMLNLFDRGVIDEQYLVQHLNVPNKEQLIDRMKSQWESRRQQEEQGNANTVRTAQAG
jgi:hypothetical protein